MRSDVEAGFGVAPRNFQRRGCRCDLQGGSRRRGGVAKSAIVSHLPPTLSASLICRRP
jgi:hypothetical protein